MKGKFETTVLCDLDRLQVDGVALIGTEFELVLVLVIRERFEFDHCGQLRFQVCAASVAGRVENGVQIVRRIPAVGISGHAIVSATRNGLEWALHILSETRGHRSIDISAERISTSHHFCPGDILWTGFEIVGPQKSLCQVVRPVDGRRGQSGVSAVSVVNRRVATVTTEIVGERMRCRTCISASRASDFDLCNCVNVAF